MTTTLESPRDSVSLASPPGRVTTPFVSPEGRAERPFVPGAGAPNAKFSKSVCVPRAALIVISCPNGCQTRSSRSTHGCGERTRGEDTGSGYISPGTPCLAPGLRHVDTCERQDRVADETARREHEHGGLVARAAHHRGCPQDEWER